MAYSSLPFPTLPALFVTGLLLAVVFRTWRRAALTWNNWFPLFRKAAQFVLWTLAAVLALASLVLLFEAPASTQASAGAAWAAGLCTPLLVRLLRQRKPKQRTERGARIAEAREVAAQVKKTREPADIVLGGVPIPRKAETFHMLVAGSTGSGKSVAIKTILARLRERGDTVIAVDSGGEFCSLLYRPDTDYIINPFDARCAPWSPLAEMAGPWDAGALARSMVPDGTGESREWNSYAQTFVSSCLQALAERGRTRLSDLLWAVQSASVRELAQLLDGTPAAAQLAAEKTFGSIRTIATNYLGPYNYLAEHEQPFSVSRFIRGATPGFLFLTYRDDQLDSVRNLVACVLDVAARTILSMPPDPRRRVWLVIDEFASIGRVQSVEAVATKARKAGGCLVIGLQSVAQLRDRYGEHAAQSILSCLSTWLVLRCADAETADYMSRYLGEAEVVRVTESASNNDAGVASRSFNEQKANERLVMASQLQQLPDLQGFLKLTGQYPVCAVTLAYPKMPKSTAAAFEARDFQARPMLRPAAQTTPAPAPAPAVAGKAVVPQAPAAPFKERSPMSDAKVKALQQRREAEAAEKRLQAALQQMRSRPIPSARKPTPGAPATGANQPTRLR
jgi:type IV secretory pathway TraG/TraD family ATPase VirD4